MNKQQSDIILAAKGFVMGAADLVPGVSGGTVALLVGIYERLINTISNVSKVTLPLLRKMKFKEAILSIDWRFIVVLGAGILAAIGLLSGPIAYALKLHEASVMAVFLGLVLASIWVLRHRVTWKHTTYNALALGTIFAYWLTGLVPGATSTHPLAFFFAGAIAISAMILPGISGSFLLVVMGKYEQVLTAVHERDLATTAVFGFGVVVGVLVFSRVVNYLLSRYYDVTMAALLGFMLGATRKLWPWRVGEANVFPSEFDGKTLQYIGLILLGSIFVVLIDRTSKKK